MAQPGNVGAQDVLSGGQIEASAELQPPSGSSASSSFAEESSSTSSSSSGDEAPVRRRTRRRRRARSEPLPALRHDGSGGSAGYFSAPDAGSVYSVDEPPAQHTRVELVMLKPEACKQPRWDWREVNVLASVKWDRIEKYEDFVKRMKSWLRDEVRSTSGTFFLYCIFRGEQRFFDQTNYRHLPGSAIVRLMMSIPTTFPLRLHTWTPGNFVIEPAEPRLFIEHARPVISNDLPHPALAWPNVKADYRILSDIRRTRSLGDIDDESPTPVLRQGRGALIANINQDLDWRKGIRPFDPRSIRRGPGLLARKPRYFPYQRRTFDRATSEEPWTREQTRALTVLDGHRREPSPMEMNYDPSLRPQQPWPPTQDMVLPFSKVAGDSWVLDMIPRRKIVLQLHSLRARILEPLSYEEAWYRADKAFPRIPLPFDGVDFAMAIDGQLRIMTWDQFGRGKQLPKTLYVTVRPREEVFDDAFPVYREWWDEEKVESWSVYEEDTWSDHGFEERPAASVEEIAQLPEAELSASAGGGTAVPEHLPGPSTNDAVNPGQAPRGQIQLKRPWSYGDEVDDDDDDDDDDSVSQESRAPRRRRLSVTPSLPRTHTFLEGEPTTIGTLHTAPSQAHPHSVADASHADPRPRSNFAKPAASSASGVEGGGQANTRASGAEPIPETNARDRDPGVAAKRKRSGSQSGGDGSRRSSVGGSSKAQPAKRARRQVTPSAPPTFPATTTAGDPHPTAPTVQEPASSEIQARDPPSSPMPAPASLHPSTSAAAKGSGRSEESAGKPGDAAPDASNSSASPTSPIKASEAQSPSMVPRNSADDIVEALSKPKVEAAPPVTSPRGHGEETGERRVSSEREAESEAEEEEAAATEDIWRWREPSYGLGAPDELTADNLKALGNRMKPRFYRPRQDDVWSWLAQDGGALDAADHLLEKDVAVRGCLRQPNALTTISYADKPSPEKNESGFVLPLVPGLGLLARRKRVDEIENRGWGDAQFPAANAPWLNPRIFLDPSRHRVRLCRFVNLTDFFRPDCPLRAHHREFPNVRSLVAVSGPFELPDGDPVRNFMEESLLEHYRSVCTPCAEARWGRYNPTPSRKGSGTCESLWALQLAINGRVLSVEDAIASARLGYDPIDFQVLARPVETIPSGQVFLECGWRLAAVADRYLPEPEKMWRPSRARMKMLREEATRKMLREETTRKMRQRTPLVIRVPEAGPSGESKRAIEIATQRLGRDARQAPMAAQQSSRRETPEGGAPARIGQQHDPTMPSESRPVSGKAGTIGPGDEPAPAQRQRQRSEEGLQHPQANPTAAHLQSKEEPEEGEKANESKVKEPR